MVLASLAAAPSAAGLFGAALALLMLSIAVIDAQSFIIPDELTLAGFGLGLAQAGTLAADDVSGSVLLAGIRGLVLALGFLALRVTYRRLRGRQGLGLGDVKLAAVAGAWLDWTMMPVAIEIAALAALTYYLVLRLVAHAPLSRVTRLPFGLFLGPSIWAGWLIETVLFPA